MTPGVYAKALDGAQPVAYHEDFCAAPKSLGLYPCNCGAIQELRRLQSLRPPDFSCRECGKECDSAPAPPKRAVCPDCCPDHDYRYEPEERGHRCRECGRAPDPDWYDED